MSSLSKYFPFFIFHDFLSTNAEAKSWSFWAKKKDNFGGTQHALPIVSDFHGQII